ncbi:pyridoxamine 5'-phosphate oxidase family protein [Enterococcus termitis]
MEIHERIVRLLNSSKVFLLATIDKREFPSVITVSAPLWREGLLKLQFYLDGEGETVKNIRHNPNGSVCCYEEIAHESLLLKGKFSIEEVYSAQEVEPKLSAYQKNWIIQIQSWLRLKPGQREFIWTKKPKISSFKEISFHKLTIIRRVETASDVFRAFSFFLRSIHR